MLERPVLMCVVALCHCFLRSVGEFWWFFSGASWVCATCPRPLAPWGSRAVWSCLHLLGPVCWQTLGSPDGCLRTPVGGHIPPLLLQLSALRRVPRGPLHLLSVVKASQALAVAQWSCRQHPQAFLASTLSGSSRCWDLSKPLRPWEQENGRLT